MAALEDKESELCVLGEPTGTGPPAGVNSQSTGMGLCGEVGVVQNRGMG